MELSLSKKILRTLLVTLVILLFLAGLFLVLYFSGVWEEINSPEKLKFLILSWGVYGRGLFVFLQFLQVTFVPIPSPVLIIAGSLIYGPFQATILSLSGILFGSAFAFFLGRIFGQKIVKFMVGDVTSKKWKAFLNKSKYSFVLMMLLPFFPDDILCLVAGITDMTWLFFMATQFLSRPIGIFLVSYFSDGKIIPYHGWGLIVWAVIILVSFFLIYLSNKYSENIENFLKKTFHKNEKISKKFLKNSKNKKLWYIKNKK